eukprot:TRINITY_DN3718_c0_g1_i4.p1 TRINITY_DN3718_c0_g1~~TRINITY_DN3718_c0_g1_i4.p1  ORF type:complete len:314 (-),score=61.18 TRINITY_DN3718_c0_g1_i4:17-958(-)
MSDFIKLFCGNANRELARKMASYLGCPIAKAEVSKFPDGEIKVQIQCNVRGSDVFVIQPICPPKVNDHLMELLVIMDALKRASAKRITAVVPYYAYGRQDRKHTPRSPITAKLVADLISSVGPARVLTLDLHSSQIQGYFNIPVDNLKSDPVLCSYLISEKPEIMKDLVIVAPDAGAAKRARRIATRLKAKMAMIDKRRDSNAETKFLDVVGDIAENAVIVDDIIDTGETICDAATALHQKGAKRILAMATHGVLSESAYARIEASPIQEVIVTDSFPLYSKNKVKILSVAPLMAEAIRRIHNEESVSALFAL